MKEKHTLLVTVENRIGVLARITGLLSSRGYNIESFIAWPTENAEVYQVQIVLYGMPDQVQQISKQIQKLIDTVKVVDIPHRHSEAIREFALVKVPTRKDRAEILNLIGAFDAKIVDCSPSFLTVDLFGPTRKIDQFLELMKPLGLREYVRSGEITIG